MNRLRVFGLDLFAIVLVLVASVLVVSILVNIPLVRELLFPAQIASSIEVVEYPRASDVYQVEIRNGVGVTGIAEQMRSYLRSKGYDVVGVDNHTSFDVDQTMIIDRIGDLEIARQVAASLGLSAERIQQDVRSEFHLDVSIILGKDYGLIPPFADPPDVPEIQDSNGRN